MVDEARIPVSLAELKASRDIVAPGPSGHVYKIRPLNLERHALAGGLPVDLRKAAMSGIEGVNKLFAAEDGALSEQGSELKNYLDGLVRQVIVEPSLEGDEALELLPPVDYRWALNIAFGEEEYDGEERRLWGREPISRFRLFRAHHSCADDCEACGAVVAELSGLR